MIYVSTINSHRVQATTKFHWEKNLNNFRESENQRRQKKKKRKKERRKEESQPLDSGRQAGKVAAVKVIFWET